MFLLLAPFCVICVTVQEIRGKELRVNKTWCGLYMSESSSCPCESNADEPVCACLCLAVRLSRLGNQLLGAVQLYDGPERPATAAGSTELSPEAELNRSERPANSR